MANKALIFITGVLIVSLSFINFADANKYTKIECAVKGSYGATFSVTKRLAIETGREVKKDMVTISYSDSECEDSTTVRMSTKELKEMEAGKFVSAQVSHEEPDFNVTAVYGLCRYK